jgi:hypothetical protein
MHPEGRPHSVKHTKKLEKKLPKENTESQAELQVGGIAPRKLGYWFSPAFLITTSPHYPFSLVAGGASLKKRIMYVHPSGEEIKRAHRSASLFIVRRLPSTRVGRLSGATINTLTSLDTTAAAAGLRITAVHPEASSSGGLR